MEIGAAAGVTGAALYRYFDTKTGVLAALFDRVIDELLEGADAASVLDEDPRAVLRQLIALHVEFALRDRAVLAVYAQEIHNLAVDDRTRLRRKQRQYVEIWRALLESAHPTMDGDQALVRVEAVFGLLNSVPNLSGSLSDTELYRELCRIAAAALHAPSGS
jgi:AcrR family transcriptional regulator